MNSIKLFQEKKIRSMWNEEEQQWYFSVVYVVGVLADIVNSTDYLKKMRKWDEELATYLGTNCPQVDMLTDTEKKKNFGNKCIGNRKFGISSGVYERPV